MVQFKLRGCLLQPLVLFYEITSNTFSCNLFVLIVSFVVTYPTFARYGHGISPPRRGNKGDSTFGAPEVMQRVVKSRRGLKERSGSPIDVIASPFLATAIFWRLRSLIVIRFLKVHWTT